MLEEKVEFDTARQMIDKDEDFSLPSGKSIVKVDLACGQKKKEGYLGIDKVKTEQTDIVHDLLEFPWPFVDESIYEFRAEHFVEHLPMQLKDGSNGLIRFMEEVYRCLQMYGTIEIIVPYYMSCEAYQDPTHCRFMTDRSFMYFDKSVVEGTLDHYTGECNFEQLTRTFILGPEWEGRADEARSYAMRYYWNVIKEMKVVLRKK